MALTLGSQKAQLNVTPMIDVLLVLIIIFMVILPPLSVGLDTKVPQPSQDPRSTMPPEDIVITVLGGGKLRLNELQTDVANLGAELREILKKSTAGAAFLKAGKDVEFGEIAEAIDVAKGAGWEKVALLTE